MTLVNFGSGPYPLAGWINVDLDAAGRPEVVADLARALPFADGCADAIFTEDFVAQLEPDALADFLAECRRMLKTGGHAAGADAGPEALRAHLPRRSGAPDPHLDDGGGRSAAQRHRGRRAQPRHEARGPMAVRRRVVHAHRGARGSRYRRVAYGESRHPAMRGIDLRKPDEAISMYLECTPAGPSVGPRLPPGDTGRAGRFRPGSAGVSPAPDRSRASGTMMRIPPRRAPRALPADRRCRTNPFTVPRPWC